jgi:competence protein CoiA
LVSLSTGRNGEFRRSQGSALLIALVNSQRALASPKLKKGQCPICLQPVTAKCGVQRAWHWAHDSKKDCDSWWEETEWHRAWKSRFPLEWQEVVLYDTQSGEKHLADIRTKHGLVIEFQHSPLDPQERVARESFYKNMIWIVDASHRKNDFKRFLKGSSQFLKTHHQSIFRVLFPDKVFPANWVESTKPVFFDFRDLISVDPNEKLREFLWCLLPGRVERQAVVIALNRSDIVTEVTEQSDLVEVLRKTGVDVHDFLLQSRQRTMPLLPLLPRPYYGQRRRRRF